MGSADQNSWRDISCPVWCGKWRHGSNLLPTLHTPTHRSGKIALKNTKNVSIPIPNAKLRSEISSAHLHLSIRFNLRLQTWIKSVSKTLQQSDTSTHASGSKERIPLVASPDSELTDSPLIQAPRPPTPAESIRHRQRHGTQTTEERKHPTTQLKTRMNPLLPPQRPKLQSWGQAEGPPVLQISGNLMQSSNVSRKRLQRRKQKVRKASHLSKDNSIASTAWIRNRKTYNPTLEHVSMYLNTIF